MKNVTLTIIIVTILASGAFFLYKSKAFEPKHDEIIFTIDSAIKYIVEEKKSSDVNVLKKFDGDFLKSWAVGIYNKKDFFTYKGEKYNTLGGRKIKA